MHSAASIAAMTMLLVLTAPSAVQAQWITDPHNGCRVWNQNPQEGETISWSGECKDSTAEGRGVLQWFKHGRPADRYEGELRDGKADGHGVLHKPSDDTYEGEWHEGRAHGLGRLTGRSRKYTGIWTDGCARDGDNWIGVGRNADTCH